MSRLWTRFIDAVSQRLPLPLLGLILLVLAAVVGLLWYFFPAWVPRHRPRWRKPRWRLRKPNWHWPSFKWTFKWKFRWRKRKPAEEPEPEPEPVAAEPSAEEGLPDLAPAEFVTLADRLAAEGRFAEAIRERLRGIVRDLVDRGVIEHRPGWTVTELAAAAALARPAVDAPLTGASELFSAVWYGQRPAGAEHDQRMRAFAGQVDDALAARRPVGAAA